MNIKKRIVNIYNTYKEKIIYISLILIIVLLVISLIILLTKKNKKLEENIQSDNQISLAENTYINEETPSTVIVDIKGYVENPGVYEMNATSRVNDVINASGGLIGGASVKYINLSKKVFDEMVIVIYSEEEINDLGKTEALEEVICLCEETKNDACNIENYNTSDIELSNLININTASIEELMSLPNIGEAKAESIIKYREETGEFNTIEDLMEVSGIGESVYNKIKDLITTK